VRDQSRDFLSTTIVLSRRVLTTYHIYNFSPVNRA
jgi:hypothetical protein